MLIMDKQRDRESYEEFPCDEDRDNKNRKRSTLSRTKQLHI